jgi:chromosomal replication initiation ATPase DnaA
MLKRNMENVACQGGLNMPVTVQQVVAIVQKAGQSSKNLILIAGQPGSGKSKLLRELALGEKGWKLVNCRELISEEFLELVPNVRQQEAAPLMSKDLSRLDAKVILLDDVDILFTPVLHLEPFQLLRQLSQNQIIVATWPGRYDGDKLEFIHSLSHAVEKFAVDDLTIIDIG